MTKADNEFDLLKIVLFLQYVISGRYGLSSKPPWQGGGVGILLHGNILLISEGCVKV